MYRSTLMLALVALLVFVFAGQALAFQCPKLVGQINTATATRYDPAAAAAKVAAVRAMELHQAGKHVEAEKMAKDALASLQ
jgi:hypothetical protein